MHQVSFSIFQRKEDEQCLEDVQTRRELLHKIVERVREMAQDYESIKK